MTSHSHSVCDKCLPSNWPKLSAWPILIFKLSLSTHWLSIDHRLSYPHQSQRPSHHLPHLTSSQFQSSNKSTLDLLYISTQPYAPFLVTTPSSGIRVALRVSRDQNKQEKRQWFDEMDWARDQVLLLFLQWTQRWNGRDVSGWLWSVKDCNVVCDLWWWWIRGAHYTYTL